MKVIEYSYGDQPKLPESVVALGVFDGVHIGHRRLLGMASEYAESRGIGLTVFTFRDSVGLKGGAPRIYSEEQKLKLLAGLGVDTVIVADFPSLSSLSAEKFVSSVLTDTLGARAAAAGYNFRFGRGASADVNALERLMAELGLDTLICDEITLSGETVSATVIRELIANKEIRKANTLLGTPYFLTGEVLHGRGMGTGLGFPTVNTDISAGVLLPPRGVYRSAVLHEGRIYSALTNVGTCPTFEERSTHAETYLIDFEGNLYSEKIDIYLLDYLREEKKFSTPKELIMQINIDKNKVITENGEITWQELGLK